MRRIFAVAVIAALGAISVPAMADDAGRACPPESRASMSAEAMVAQFNSIGYDVRRLRAVDGYFETSLVERESGGVVSAIFRSDTGELVRASLASSADTAPVGKKTD